MRDTRHFEEMLAERGILRQWVQAAIDAPDRVEDRDDGTRHFLKRIPEHGQRWLRVVVNMEQRPPVRVTAFFDRRLGRGGP